MNNTWKPLTRFGLRHAVRWRLQWLVRSLICLTLVFFPQAQRQQTLERTKKDKCEVRMSLRKVNWRELTH